MTVRRFACRCIERWTGAVVALGACGIIGFVISLVAFSQRYASTSGYLAGVAVSLALYGGALLVGYLGDPFELERRRQRNASARGAEYTPTSRSSHA